MKVLEDTDVMQLHYFLDAFNQLISSTAKASLTLASCGNVSCCTPVVERHFAPEDFTPRRGVMTRYAKQMVRPEMYGTVRVVDLDWIGSPASA